MRSHAITVLPASFVLGLNAYGVGRGGSSTSNSASSGASAGATSSGAIKAFGSVFVNGHEFVTSHATMVDDDTGTTSASSALEVGEVVDVKLASNSTDQNPVASELHIHPLARSSRRWEQRKATTSRSGPPSIAHTARWIWVRPKPTTTAAASADEVVRGSARPVRLVQAPAPALTPTYST